MSDHGSNEVTIAFRASVRWEPNGVPIDLRRFQRSTVKSNRGACEGTRRTRRNRGVDFRARRSGRECGHHDAAGRSSDRCRGAGPDGALAALSRDAIWLQMGTIGIEWTDRLGKSATDTGAMYVDAPVSGSVGPATAGQLVILASGPDEAHGVADPIFTAIGSHTFWLGPAGAGSGPSSCSTTGWSTWWRWWPKL